MDEVEIELVDRLGCAADICMRKAAIFLYLGRGASAMFTYVCLTYSTYLDGRWRS
jgi:hypothetical protein